MEPGVFGSLEPEPLEKKTGAGAAWEKNQEPEPEPLEKKSGAGAGAGAEKKFAGSPALIYIYIYRFTRFKYNNCEKKLSCGFSNFISTISNIHNNLYYT